MCAELLGVPAAGGSAERLKVGNTNALYRLTLAAGTYLVRVFGDNPALDFDRKAENSIYTALSAQGLAPELVALFGNGRVEAWLEGRPATLEECRSTAVSCQVAAQLARLHRFQPPAELQREPVAPWGWKTARKWLANARQAAEAAAGLPASPRAGEARSRLLALDLEKVARQCAALEVKMTAEPLPLCFAHNDLSNTNVHWDPDRKIARLIDFEYGGLNYRGFDLATHLSHWAGGACDGRYDDGLFPSEEQRGEFLEAYVAEASRQGGTDAVLPSAEALSRELDLAAPLAHLVWGLWAVCMLPTALAGPPGPFSHIEYAERRLLAFAASVGRWD